MKYLFPILFVIVILFSDCNNHTTTYTNIPEKADSFLLAYNEEYTKLYTVYSEAQWLLNTKIIEGDTTADFEVRKAGEAFTMFTGSKGVVKLANYLLKNKNELTALQIRQLEMILYLAGGSPEIVGDIVKEKIKAENKQTQTLFGFNFMLDNKKINTNYIDSILENAINPELRLRAWLASKEVGVVLKDGLELLQSLRNQTVAPLGFKDFFHYQVADYGMNSEEMVRMNQKFVREIWPLYRELHTWARYELAKKYKQPTPEMLPAHWLPNRWGQEWSSMVNVEGINIDIPLREKSAEWIVREGEKFYISLGFPALPESFYTLSSLYPLPSDANYSKNNHASAWHMNLDKDVRSLMSVEPNTRWWGTTLHELGHIYYYLTYSNKDVPPVLRGGANRAYHEAFGTLIGLASMQKPFLSKVGLINNDVTTNDTLMLLKEALDYVVLMPWASGVMTEFEYELYSKNLPKNEYNKRWWELVKKYQGIVPPSERGEIYCDAATKTHINDDAAQYYDYALSNVMLFQVHEHIAKNILKQDPHQTNYYGSKETGAFLKKMMYPGATVNWPEHMKENLGEELSARAMMNYFMPLMDWLKSQNKGRAHSLPANIN